MKIAVTTLGCDAGKSGIGRYAMTLAERWLAEGVEMTLFGLEAEREVFDPVATARDWQSVPARWASPVANVLWHQARLPTLARGADVLFLPAGNRRLPLRHTVPAVGTVHDCSSLHIAGKYDRARDLYIKRVLPWMMQQLDHVITVSHSTERDLVEHCGVPAERISVIPLAADPEVFYPRDRAACREELARRYGLMQPFLLYSSRIEHPGKGHVQLIRAFEQMKQQYRLPHELVFVGPDRERAAEVHEAAADSDWGDEIRFTGAVDGDDLPLFYNAAEMLVLPSLFEGFGLPLLEAMACGTPTACSGLSSLPEVAGGCAELFDPYEPESMVEAMVTVLQESPAARQARVVAGLARAASMSWQRTSEETLAVLAAVSQGVSVPSFAGMKSTAGMGGAAVASGVLAGVL